MLSILPCRSTKWKNRIIAIHDHPVTVLLVRVGYPRPHRLQSTVPFGSIQFCSILLGSIPHRFHFYFISIVLASCEPRKTVLGLRAPRKTVLGECESRKIQIRMPHIEAVAGAVAWSGTSPTWKLCFEPQGTKSIISRCQEGPGDTREAKT